MTTFVLRSRMACAQVVLWELVTGDRISMRNLCRLRHAILKASVAEQQGQTPVS